MGFYIDEARLVNVRLSPRALVFAEMVKTGAKLRPFDARGFDAVCQLIEADVLLHTIHDTREDRLRHLAEIVEADDPR